MGSFWNTSDISWYALETPWGPLGWPMKPHGTSAEISQDPFKTPLASEVFFFLKPSETPLSTPWSAFRAAEVPLNHWDPLKCSWDLLEFPWDPVVSLRAPEFPWNRYDPENNLNSPVTFSYPWNPLGPSWNSLELRTLRNSSWKLLSSLKSPLEPHGGLLKRPETP